MSPPPSQPDDGRTLRVVSYNVHRCIGLDDRLDPHRVAAVLRRQRPDIAVLQEVDTGLDERTGLGQLAILAQGMELEPIIGPTVEREHGFFGNAILSRFPAREVERLDLTVEGCEPRVALDVAFELGSMGLRVIGTHLGLSAGERHEQFGRLLGRLHTHPRGRAAVVAGDFNEWFDWSRNVRRMNSYLGWQPRRSTYPSHRPLLALDRIWVAPRTLQVDSGVDRSDEARIASDHLPVWADLKVGEGGA